jgi:hypothetical protein
MFFAPMLRRLIRHGTLRLITANGKIYIAGDSAPSVTVRLHRRKPGWAFALRLDLKIARAYEEGGLTIAEGSLRDFHYILFVNGSEAEKQLLFRIFDSPQKKVARDDLIQIFGFAADCRYRYSRIPATPQANGIRLKSLRPAAFRFRALAPKSWFKHFPFRLRFGKRNGKSAVTLSASQYKTVPSQGKILAAAWRGEGPASPLGAKTDLRRQYADALKLMAARLQKHKQNFVSFYAGKRQPLLLGDISFGRPASAAKARLRINKRSTVPWTRDYIYKWERATRAEADHFVRQETS